MSGEQAPEGVVERLAEVLMRQSDVDSDEHYVPLWRADAHAALTHLAADPEAVAWLAEAAATGVETIAHPTDDAPRRRFMRTVGPWVEVTE